MEARVLKFSTEALRVKPFCVGVSLISSLLHAVKVTTANIITEYNFTLISFSF